MISSVSRLIWHTNMSSEFIYDYKLWNNKPGRQDISSEESEEYQVEQESRVIDDPVK